MERYIDPLVKLLVFEIILSTLGEKFCISQARFSDPDFSPTDCAFLEERGHEVVPYPHNLVPDVDYFWRKGVLRADQRIIRNMTERTFLCAPYSTQDGKHHCTLAEVIGVVKPCLFYGSNLLGDLGWQGVDSGL